jgi:hypothetical protein
LAAEGVDAAAGEQHPLLLIDDAGDDRGFDVLFLEIHKGQNSEFRIQESEERHFHSEF